MANTPNKYVSHGFLHSHFYYFNYNVKNIYGFLDIDKSNYIVAGSYIAQVFPLSRYWCDVTTAHKCKL